MTDSTSVIAGTNAKRTFTVQNDIDWRHKCILFASEQNDIIADANATRMIPYGLYGIRLCILYFASDNI